MSAPLPEATAPLTVRPYDGAPEAWNAFVAQDPQGSTFHRMEWRALFREHYGHETPYLAAWRGTTLAGVLPLVRVRSLVFGHYLVSLPFVSYGGPLGDAAAQRALGEAAAGIANGARLVELRSRAPLADPGPSLTLVSRKLTVVRDLVPGDYDATFKQFDSKLRSQVRRAEREGLAVRFGHDQLAAWHRVFAEHMRDLGSPAHGLAFFARLCELLGERAWVGVAWLGNEPVAGGFAIENGTEVEISWASALRRHAKIAPNMALYGAFIRRACERGFAAFNFGRCTPDSGTHRFKRQWGSRDEPLAWYQAGASQPSAPPNPDQGAYGTAVKVWQKLPLAFTTPVGARLIGGFRDARGTGARAHGFAPRMTVRSLVRGAAEAMLVRLPRRTAVGDRLVLAYHNIVPSGYVSGGDRSLHLPLDRFEAQLALLRQEADVVPLMELLSTPDPSRRRVAITFDDAYASALTLGVGACQAGGLPCTVFVSPGLLGRVPLWDRRALAGQWGDVDRETFLWQAAGRDTEPPTPSELALDATLRIATVEELLACVTRSGEKLTLGNHTVSHPNLTALTRDEVHRELHEAQRWLLAHAPERAIPVVAYPYGQAPRDTTWSEPNDAVLPVWGLRVSGGWQRAGLPLRPLAVPRWNVPAGISDAGFVIRIRGVADGG